MPNPGKRSRSGGTEEVPSEKRGMDTDVQAEPIALRQFVLPSENAIGSGSRIGVRDDFNKGVIFK
jgi:hypothetical protein